MRVPPKKERPFPLGQCVITANAQAVLPFECVLESLARHARGDWGELDSEDVAANEHALHEGERLVSVYVSPSGMRFYVITERDRSATTVLLPEDY
jgi:hypothetical protein